MFVHTHTHAAVSLLNAPTLLSIMVCGVYIYVHVCKVWNDNSGLHWGGGRRQSKGMRVQGDFSCGRHQWLPNSRHFPPSSTLSY